jgi:prepilin-type N-terminal cleavage/methylation domain-containing protein/prepilin-type processing-associated H-X9-DG protein
MSPGRSRSAFTIIEVLVVISIIAVLVALLLPAVQQAREAARRVKCRNNLTQLGLALRTYESAHGCLPPGSVDTNGPVANDGKGYQFGWIVQVLPHLEQASLFSVFDFSVSVYDPRNAKFARDVRTVQLPVLICPSKNQQYPGDYAGCHHDVEAPIDVDNHGVLFLNSSIRHEDIPDGVSHTLFVGEHVGTTHGLAWATGTSETLRNTGTPINGWTRQTPGGALPIPPPERGKSLPVGGFSSQHSGGANFVFGDGSTHFINQMVSMLGHRADGELPAGEY